MSTRNMTLRSWTRRRLLPLVPLALFALFVAVLAAPDDAQAADPATVTKLGITSSPRSGDTYGPDETIQVTVTFSEAVTVTGVPFLRLNVGGSIEQPEYTSGSGSAAIVFEYTVAATDRDTDGVSIPKNPVIRVSRPDQDGNVPTTDVTIRSADGTDANPNHQGLSDQASHKVDGSLDNTPPTIYEIGMLSVGGGTGNDTYDVGDEIAVYVTFSQVVVVTGTPTLVVTIGTNPRSFSYVPRSLTVFTYTVQAGDTDTDGISISANSLRVPTGASIKDKAGHNAVVTHAALPAQSDHKVNVGGL